MSIDPESRAWFSAGPAVNVWVESVSGARSLVKIPCEMPTRAGAWVRLGKYPRWTVIPLAVAPPVVGGEEAEEAEDPQAAATSVIAARPTPAAVRRTRFWPRSAQLPMIPPFSIRPI